jgi:hypothetical protein
MPNLVNALFVGAWTSSSFWSFAMACSYSWSQNYGITHPYISDFRRGEDPEPNYSHSWQENQHWSTIR